MAGSGTGSLTTAEVLRCSASAFSAWPGSWPSFCPGFDVLVTPIINQEYGLFFSDGSVIVTGRLVDQLTNLSNGNSITVNASGPARVSDDGTTVTLLGETLIADMGGFRYPGSPPDTELVSGRVVLGATGIVSETGHIRDLCTELA